jgi:arginine/ornithine transport system permease protein
VLRASDKPWLSRPVWLFTYVFRGTPLLVQMYILYYGLAESEAVRASILWPFLKHASVCAWLAFGLNTAAYSCEIFAGALRATAPGEVEAATAFGMGPWTRMRRILLPGALRRSLPAYSNEVMFTLHGTALASTVTLMDLGGVARAVSMRHAAPFEPYVAALVGYALLTGLVLLVFRWAEGRWLLHLKRPKAA